MPRTLHAFEHPWLQCLSFVPLIALAACSGTAGNSPPMHRPGPQASGYYGTYVPSDLALGRAATAERQGARRAADVTPYVKPERRPEVAVRATRTRPAPKASSSPVVPASPEAAPASPLALAPQPPKGADTDAQRYAAREQQGSKQMGYRGGDVVVISVSTLLIILIIVLIVLLLT